MTASTPTVRADVSPNSNALPYGRATAPLNDGVSRCASLAQHLFDRTIEGNLPRAIFFHEIHCVPLVGIFVMKLESGFIAVNLLVAGFGNFVGFGRGILELFLDGVVDGLILFFRGLLHDGQRSL